MEARAQPCWTSYTCGQCPKVCLTSGGLAKHKSAKHGPIIQPNQDSGEEENAYSSHYHDFMTASPCDANGTFLPPNTPPPPSGFFNPERPDNWTPFDERYSFDFAHFHFVEAQTSAGGICKALEIWAASVLQYGGEVPWKNAEDLYTTIDQIQHGSAPWKTYVFRYTGPRPMGTPPRWMTETWELCTRDARLVLHNQLGSPELNGHINYVPYRQFDKFGKRVAYPCALVHWMRRVADEPDEDTGLWIVRPDYEGNGRPFLGVVHLDCIARAAHLIGVYGSHFLPEDFHFRYALDSFHSYYVNKYGDHHLHEFVY